jgi:apolipoprotein N-acyltransferase
MLGLSTFLFILGVLLCFSDHSTVKTQGLAGIIFGGGLGAFSTLIYWLMP